MKKKLPIQKHHTLKALRIFLWFSLGALLGLFFFVSFLVIFYRHTYQGRVYPGIFLDGTDFGGKTQQEVSDYFFNKNAVFAKTTFTFTANGVKQSITAKELRLGFDQQLLSAQAYGIGRSNGFLSNIYMITLAYMNGIHLPASYHLDEQKFAGVIEPFQQTINVEPINAEITIENGKVKEFHSHTDGKKVDTDKTHELLASYAISLTRITKPPKEIAITVPVVDVKPEITLEKVNNLGIKELVGKGTSVFHGSITNRIYNINRASSFLNGVLIKPGETFSFAKTVGDVSAQTGYKQAYVITNGRTVLGDGGGVCQVSTTLFRAALDAGLPIVERNQHAYRVHYYEEDSPPGIDAAVYVPNVDFRFTNDTDHWLLIQTVFNLQEERLTFELYGTKDGRQVTMTTPVILSQTPAPEPLYQDDPTLPTGVVKQVDWAAAGAKVTFTRDVVKDGKVIIHDVFNTNYRPWQAVYLRGTGPAT
ncbi:MAG: VanW family protein [bacterium]|nr:VanW family protein [bacterium]